MIPKQVADRLRKGQNPIDTCQVWITPPIAIDIDLSMLSYLIFSFFFFFSDI
jgi:hypothetical protein